MPRNIYQALVMTCQHFEQLGTDNIVEDLSTKLYELSDNLF
jgi:hypothetical protein